MNNDNPVNPIPNLTPEYNISNLDHIGRFITASIQANAPIMPYHAALIAKLIADCRVYCTIRDQAVLTDKTSTDLLANIRSEQIAIQSEEESMSNGTAAEVADSIIAELRKSGINL